MSRALANRIAKLEPRPPVVDAPHVVMVRPGETTDDARARFRTTHRDSIRGRHGLIVVPARVETPEDEAEFAAKFEISQTTLIAAARSARPKDEFDE